MVIVELNECKIVYDNALLSAQIFIYDIFNMSDDIKSAQLANILMEDIMVRTGLELNLDKSSYLILGNRKKQEENVNRDGEKSSNVTGYTNEGSQSDEVFRRMFNSMVYQIYLFVYSSN